MTDQMQETQLGSLYPKDHVIAVIAETAAAEDAATALEREGFARSDIQLHAPAIVVADEADRQEQLSWLEKIGAFVSDEDEWSRQYQEFAERGEWLLTVRVEDDEDIELARDVLLRHGAHSMRHYGAATVTELVAPN